MRPPVQIAVHPARCTLFGRRVHHGLVGLILLLSDVHDWRVWLRDLLAHPNTRR